MAELAGEGTARTLKRRGILAAAGAVVAGLVAKQVAQPVAATSGGGDQGPMIIGSNPFYKASGDNTNTPNVSSVATELDASINFGNFLGSSEPFVFKADAAKALGGNIDGLRGYAKGTGSGVYGVSDQGIFAKGVEGFSPQGTGVVGTVAGSGGKGVHGVNQAGGYGVYGEAAAGGTGVNGVVTGSNIYSAGVFGNSGTNGYGVYGTSTNGFGVYGLVTGGIGVGGIADTGFGVVGQTSGSSTVAGVYGSSTTTYGIIGKTTAAGYSGLTAITNTPNVAALGATSTVPNAFAAFFTGTTVVNGDFAVTGNKSAAVAHPDGTHRLLYCVESPEAWFEDFGKAKLVGGKAEVKLDPDFAALVHGDDYHVFLTAYGNTNGLHVTSQNAGGFAVQEHNSGTGSLMIGWRVVAKRKDNPGTRLEKFVLPKINHPDPDKLPKPESPKKP